MVGAHEVLAGELVQARGQALGAAGARCTNTIVDAVRADQLEQPRVDRRPDRRATSAAGSRVGVGSLRAGRPSSAMSSTGTIDLEVERLAVAGVDDRDRARRPSARVAAEEPRDLLERALRGRQPDPLRRRLGRSASSRSSESARCAPRFVAASAWISSTITSATPRSVSRAARREHQVERLGRRDQDVGRLAASGAPLVLAGVSPVRTPTVGHVGQRERRAARRRAGSRRAARAGSSRRRRRAPAAARCRGPACAVQAPAAARPRAGRSPTGTRRASCPTRWAPGSACGRRRRSAGQPSAGRGGRVERGLEPRPDGGGEGRVVHG